MQRNWSSLIRPKRVDVDEATRTRCYGEFTVQPLERGYGVTPVSYTHLTLPTTERV